MRVAIAAAIGFTVGAVAAHNAIAPDASTVVRLAVTIAGGVAAAGALASLVNTLSPRRARTRAPLLEHGSPTQLARGAGGRSPYELGISESSVATRYRESGDKLGPYVDRTQDRALDRAADEGGPILILGPSKSGKSRTAFELCKRRFPDRQLLTVRPGKALDDALEWIEENERDMPPSVLWLDDIDRQLELAKAADLTTIAQIARATSVAVVATAQTAALRQFADPKRIKAAASVIKLDDELTADERHDAKLKYPREDPGKIGRLAEHLVAADELIERLDDAAELYDDGLGPEGEAVVDAAIDLRRTGHAQAIPESWLRQMFIGHQGGGYLRKSRPSAQPTEDGFRMGLARACQPVSSSIALLAPAENGVDPTYDPFDYAVAYRSGSTHRTGHPQPIPAECWRFALNVASQAQARKISRNAARYALASKSSSEIEQLVDVLIEATQRNLLPADSLARCAMQFASKWRLATLEKLMPVLTEEAEQLQTSTVIVLATTLIVRGQVESAESLVAIAQRAAEQGRAQQTGVAGLAAALLRARRPEPARRLLLTVAAAADDMAPEQVAICLLPIGEIAPTETVAPLIPPTCAGLRTGSVPPKLAMKVGIALVKGGKWTLVAPILEELIPFAERGELSALQARELASRLTLAGSPDDARRLLRAMAEAESKNPTLQRPYVLALGLRDIDLHEEAGELLEASIEQARRGDLSGDQLAWRALDLVEHEPGIDIGAILAGLAQASQNGDADPRPLAKVIHALDAVGRPNDARLLLDAAGGRLFATLSSDRIAGLAAGFSSSGSVALLSRTVPALAQATRERTLWPRTAIGLVQRLHKDGHYNYAAMMLDALFDAESKGLLNVEDRLKLCATIRTTVGDGRDSPVLDQLLRESERHELPSRAAGRLCLELRLRGRMKDASAVTASLASAFASLQGDPQVLIGVLRELKPPKDEEIARPLLDVLSLARAQGRLVHGHAGAVARLVDRWEQDSPASRPSPA